MTIDERLEFLVKDSESLHSSMHEAFQRMREADERQVALNRKLNKAMRAMAAAMRAAFDAYVDEIDSIDSDEETNGQH